MENIFNYFRPQIKGDNGDSYGLYQYQEKIWKPAKSDSVQHQTEKVEEILSILIKQYGYKEAVRKYNGNGKQSYIYQQKVFSIIEALNTRIGYAGL